MPSNFLGDEPNLPRINVSSEEFDPIVKLGQDSDGVNIASAYSPIYVVLFESPNFDANEPPLLIGTPQDDSQASIPHGLSRDVSRALPALWYCLHLPGSFQQVLDLSASGIKAAQQLSMGPKIWLAPTSVFESLWPVSNRNDSGTPLLLVVPDREIDDISTIARRLQLSCPIVAYSNLSGESLKEHWNYIRSNIPAGLAQIASNVNLSFRLDTAPTFLPYRWLARQFEQDTGGEPTNDQEVEEVIYLHLEALLMVSTLASLEDDDIEREDAMRILPDRLEVERHRLSVPVTLGIPGVPRAYTRRVYAKEAQPLAKPWPRNDDQDNWTTLREDDPDNSLVERSAIEFLTAHGAIARGGMGLVLETVPQALFEIVDQIERHCIAKAHGPTVWRLLHRLYSASESLWNYGLRAAVARASHLTVFSNFPFGLLRHPDVSAPILSRTPISYRSLLPLTRAVQYEIGANYSFGFPTRRVRILVAECIEPDDHVGKISRTGWEISKAQSESEGRPLDFHICETLTVDALNKALTANPCDILTISAHGFYDVKSNVAGLVIGTECTLGIGLGPLPPVVVLSACHVLPMGVAAVRVVDMLLREGAMAVLGTQIPVDVVHNAVLMARLFVYIAESLNGTEPHITLSDAWQHVQSSNPINDIANSNPYLRRWLLESREGKSSRLVEFMSTASTGRLRSSHIYKDTENVLIEMAKSEGVGAKV